MSKIRTHLVGRDPECDVPLNDGSVSRFHAEVVRLPDGNLFVTDRASMNGTFVLDRGQWRAIRQAFLEPGDQVRFGEYRTTAAELGRLCAERDGEPDRGAEKEAAPPHSKNQGEGKRRNAETGEIVYDEASRRG